MNLAVESRSNAVPELIRKMGLPACGEEAEPAARDVAHALTMLAGGQPEEAVRVLQGGVLAAHPDYAPANVVLGFALRRAGMPGSQDCFSRVLAVSLDSDTRAAAQAILLSA